jgi:para-nitrobenzyl esterase
MTLEARETRTLRSAVVHTPAGPVRGTLERGAAVFRGIPYAEPARRSLRFAPPVPRTPWVDVFEATEFGAASLQNVDGLSMDMPGAEEYYYRPATARFSEDCLNLSVWAPADYAGEPLPVMVWIHGGGFLTGSGSSDWFDGARLAQREHVVVVTVTYRLGVLGNLWLGDFDEAATNLGTRDQIAALNWVHESISAFGGDPERVTVFGQSAGGMSVAALLLSPLARGLFRRAIVQSGHLDLFPTIDQAREHTARVLSALKIEVGPDTLSQLRRVSTIRLLEVQKLMPIGTVAPVADGNVLPSDPLGALERGAASDVTVLQGNTASENALFHTVGVPWLTGDLRASIAELAEGRADESLITAALAEYRSDCIDDREAWDRATSDAGWLVPAGTMTDAHTRSGGTTYAYEFGWRSRARAGEVGAAHEVDVPFVFDNLDAPGADELLGTGVATDPDVARLAQTISSAWAAFARDGVPAAEGLPTWEPTTPEARRTMWLDTSPTLLRNPHAARLALWATVGPVRPIFG